MLTSARFIQTDDLGGPTNMALDEVLWHESAAGTPFLRLYGWRPRPTISLGYFQSLDELRQVAEWRELPVVRRLTGGGAIVHDDELTYSLALPSSAAPGRNDLYVRVHRAIQQMLCTLGLPAELGGTDVRGSVASHTMCFLRPDSLAVYVHGNKILGSAQRRSAASVLLHGSLLLGRSRAAPQILGLAELAGRRADDESIRKTLAHIIPGSIGLRVTPSELPARLFDRARRLAADKYATAAWNERNQLPRWTGAFALLRLRSR